MHGGHARVITCRALPTWQADKMRIALQALRERRAANAALKQELEAVASFVCVL